MLDFNGLGRQSVSQFNRLIGTVRQQYATERPIEAKPIHKKGLEKNNKTNFELCRGRGLLWPVKHYCGADPVRQIHQA